jgi:hypothetical protein
VARYDQHWNTVTVVSILSCFLGGLLLAWLFAEFFL